jgi:hypothetical protein
MLRECLVYSSMRLGVPFIAPRQLGAVESIPGRQFLPSVACTTGHSPMRISFLFWHSRPLAFWSRWRTGHCPVHTGQSGAPFRPLSRPRVTRGLRGRPLARPPVGSPDSPVNYSRTLLTWFPRAATSPQPNHRTLSGAPPDNPVIYSRTPSSRPESSLFTRASLAHRTLSGAPPDSPVHPDRAAFWLYTANFFIIVSPVSIT